MLLTRSFLGWGSFSHRYSETLVIVVYLFPDYLTNFHIIYSSVPYFFSIEIIKVSTQRS